MKEFKSNDPVMWKKKEYRFVKRMDGQRREGEEMGWIQIDNDKWMRMVPLGELDLILELPLWKD